MLRVHVNFKRRLERFIKEFERMHGIKLSTTKATKILDDKIEKSGGLVV